MHLRSWAAMLEMLIIDPPSPATMRAPTSALRRNGPVSARVSLSAKSVGSTNRRTAHDVVALTPASTSAECSPSRGAGCGGTVDSVEKRYGAPGMRTVP